GSSARGFSHAELELSDEWLPPLTALTEHGVFALQCAAFNQDKGRWERPMKPGVQSMKSSRSLIAKAGVAALVLAAAGTASVAQARDNVFFSIGANIAPGVAVTAGNAPYYY